MSYKDQKPVGELRPTQMMFTYGVGAIVDLPYLSALVMGLEDWRVDPGVVREIHEERLLQAVQWELGRQVQRLLTPPVMQETGTVFQPFDEQYRVGVPVASFPRWMLCPKCRLLAPLDSGLFDLKHNPYHPERAHYEHSNCPKGKKPPTAIPARFLVACPNGHLDDFPWVEFVHGGPTSCASILRLLEYGPGGEARDLEVKCETCGATRRLSHAFGEAGRRTMPLCRGRRPHLRDYDDKDCDQQVRAILLGASNLWFADVFTTLAIPLTSGQLAQRVIDHWAKLHLLQNEQNVALLRQLGQLGDFHGYTDAELWQAIEEKRERDEKGEAVDLRDFKSPEWEVLTHPTASPNTDDFRLREVPVPLGFTDYLTRVVLVERLREVRALVGFTRIDAPGELDDDPQVVADRRMPLSRQKPAWIPATEVRGEGIFVQFNEVRILEWLKRSLVAQRDDSFFAAHVHWRRRRNIQPEEGNFPGLRYVLLHSFAHALMRQLVLECGYVAASVRERIYSQGPDASASQMAQAGVLIYTAAPDSEGTLGGLVSLGEPEQLRRHLLSALRGAHLCASDPLCAEGLPGQQGMTLHGAACHACLFAPETSCERGNKYLDRSTLVETVECPDLAFFEVE